MQRAPRLLCESSRSNVKRGKGRRRAAGSPTSRWRFPPSRRLLLIYVIVVTVF